MDNIIFTFDPAMVVQLIVTVLLPILVGLVTKKVTSSGLKAILLALLSVITSLLTEILNAVEDGSEYDLGRGLIAAVFTFIGAVALHYGLFKPVGLAEKAQEVGMGKEPEFVDHSMDDVVESDVVEVDETPVAEDYVPKH